MKYILIIGASDLVLPAFKIAKNELGLKIIAFDMNPQAPGMLMADVPVTISTKDVAGSVAKARELSQSYDIAGVFTCGADVEITVAAIAEALNLPGVPVVVSERCNNKFIMHTHLDNKSFSAKPAYALAYSLEEAVEKVQKIGFPLFIKPLDNCGSRGVQRVETADELSAAYKLAVQNTISESGVLLEQLKSGQKYTVEMLADHGERHMISIVETHYISPRWPCEVLLNNTRLNTEEQERLFKFASQVADLMGIEHLAHKVDVSVDDSGEISLIELTARLSGGYHCQYASPMAYGTREIQAAMEIAIGQPLDVSLVEHKYEKGACVKAILPEPGVITSVEGLQQAAQMPGVERIVWLPEPGDTIGPYQNSTQRPGFVIAAGDTIDQAIANAEAAADVIHVITKD